MSHANNEKWKTVNDKGIALLLYIDLRPGQAVKIGSEPV